MKTNNEKLEKSQADAKRYYEMAYSFYAAGKYQDAEDTFRLLTVLVPIQYEFWMGLGASLQMQGKYQDAVDTFGAAAILDTDEIHPYPHFHAAECLFALGKKEVALVALNSAIAIAEKEKKDHPLAQKLNFLLKRWTL